MAKKPSPQASVKKNVVHRQYAGTVEFDSDLFMLSPAKMKRNVTPNKDADAWLDVLHQHFFHTFDSSGKKLDKCSDVGGHFHVIKVIPGEGGGLPTLEVSGPKTYAHKKGKKVMVDASRGSGEPGFDDHTHDVEYKWSSRMKPRTLNTESLKIVNEEANKLVAPEGITGNAPARPANQAQEIV